MLCNPLRPVIIILRVLRILGWRVFLSIFNIIVNAAAWGLVLLALYLYTTGEIAYADTWFYRLYVHASPSLWRAVEAFLYAGVADEATGKGGV